MNKKKLTLLIALSIIAFLGAIIILVGFKKRSQENIKEELPIVSVVQITEEEEKVIELLPLDTIAKQVINGEWGNGEERKEKLIEAGYNYEEVQKKVLELSPKKEESKITYNKTASAQEVWNAMKDKGWSDDLCAGIMGNIMAECGGNTLNLNPYGYGDSGTSFGLCQWHAGRKNTLINKFGTSIKSQIDYLEYELKNGYSNILNSTKNYKEIAYDFCVQFERPSNKHNKGIYRQKLAEIAYNTFAGK